MTTPIPTPPYVPFLGHATLIDRDVPVSSFGLLAEQYGEIYHLEPVGRKFNVVNSVALVNEVSDDKRFVKVVSGPLLQVRNVLGDGLFTAQHGENNWGIAHRLLMPAFGTASIREMFPDMLDIANQLLLKWERFGPAYKIDPVEDFTRLTLDTIALCSMTYRINSFYRENAHPFVQSMIDFLTECNNRANRPGIFTTVMYGSAAKYEQDMKVMNDLADEIIADRKATPIDKKDLLNIMLHAKDPKTGESLTDKSIRENLLTFLIAGHETTSGLINFATYFLLKHPEAMRKAREEVDEVLGDQEMQLQDLSKLPYITAVLRETIRLSPTAPARAVYAAEDTVIGNGKYAISKGSVVVVNTQAAQRDPKVWGEDSNEFKPERMLDGKFEALPPNAWQPFGYGVRACIGRPFAWQEATMALALTLQKFDLVMHDPQYTLQLKQALSIKPKEFYFHAMPRSRKPQLFATPSAAGFSRGTQPKKPKAAAAPTANTEAMQPMYVLYGSNTGTSENFAQRIAGAAATYGFRASLGSLDSVSGSIPTNGPVIVVCASFEGEPADNAAHFVEWLTSLKNNPLSELKFAVFGCGHHDWVRTFQRIPKLIDQTFEDRGGSRLVPRGEGDAGDAAFFESFDKWEANLWSVLPGIYGTVISKEDISGVEVHEIDEGTSRAEDLRQSDAKLGTVVENRVLTAPGAPEKRHIEFELPADMSFRAGDYLAILPINPVRDIHRVISRLKLSGEQKVSLTSLGPSSLPTDRPITIFSLLSGYVELSQPATTRDLEILLNAESSPETKSVLKGLIDSYHQEVLERRMSVLDLLERHPDIKLSFSKFLSIVPSMRIRQYSISSSPLANAQNVTLTVSVLEAPALSGRNEPFLGVASTYLASLRPGDKVQLAVRASSAAFHPPADPTTRMVLFAAGSGLAPMRGFLQERAMQKKAGREVGKSLLFFGCRKPADDFLYSDSDLKEWSELGIVDVRPAFSRASEQSEGCKYIQDRIHHDRKLFSEEYHNKGAKYFVCGSAKVAKGVKEVLISMIKESRGVGDEEAAAMFERVAAGRYATDIFE